MSKDNGGPAFPVPECPIDDKRFWRSELPGMTLRDYFAAKAMQGIFADGSLQSQIKANFAFVASSAYQIADAMLAERKK